jgi:hypothetical protein
MGTRQAEDERAGELLSLATEQAGSSARSWLSKAWFNTGAPFARGLFLGFYAGAARRFPGSILDLPGAARARLLDLRVPAPQVWSLSDLARAGLLLKALGASPEPDHVALATEIFRRGDTAERVALLRSLPLLPGPERFAELAIEACRSHVVDVFAAIACDNPYPAAHFPELNFNQLVIKLLFVELSLERVVGWRARANPELRRIAGDYEAERRAAHRSVPADIALIRATEDPA